jgi:putative Ca2+/H+ antiporter (TMEM165/GDT1 family)
MTGFVEIVAAAFVAQLAVLPGEKGQFVVAALATRYHPLLVVAAASTAFAGWTAVEIWLGQALESALPAVALDAITAGLFLLFAVRLYRSAPDRGDAGADGGLAETDGGDAGTGHATETDGGAAVDDLDVSLLGREVPSPLGGYLPVFALLAAGEFGDKTQLATVGLAVQYGATPAIWVGEMLAIVPVSLLNAYFFHGFAHRVDMHKAHLAGAALFAFFAADTALQHLVGFSLWETVVDTVADAVVAALPVA